MTPLIAWCQITGFALGPDLTVNFDTKLNEGIEVFWCGLVREGLSELAVEAPSEIRNLSAAIIV